MKLKHSIWQLALAVLGCGVAFRALSSPSPLWAAAILSAALAACTLALAGALSARGARRAPFAGAAACGWVYLFAAIGPWAREQAGPHLLTSAAIDLLFHSLDRSIAAPDMAELRAARQELADALKNAPGPAAAEADIRLLQVRVAGIQARLHILQELKARSEAYIAADPAGRWATWTRPAWSSFNGTPVSASIPFQQIGHGLFAIAFALFGGAFGRFIAGRRATDEALPAGPATA